MGAQITSCLLLALSPTPVTWRKVPEENPFPALEKLLSTRPDKVCGQRCPLLPHLTEPSTAQGRENAFPVRRGQAGKRGHAAEAQGTGWQKGLESLEVLKCDYSSSVGRVSQPRGASLLSPVEEVEYLEAGRAWIVGARPWEGVVVATVPRESSVGLD